PERGPTADRETTAGSENDGPSGAELTARIDGRSESRSGTAERLDPRRAGSIDGIERVALSFGLSIAITPLIGLVLNFTPFGIRLVPIVLSIGGFTLLATIAAAVRRRELPTVERFRVPYRSWIRTTRAELLEPDTRLDG